MAKLMQQNQLMFFIHKMKICLKELTETIINLKIIEIGDI